MRNSHLFYIQINYRKTLYKWFERTNEAFTSHSELESCVVRDAFLSGTKPRWRRCRIDGGLINSDRDSLPTNGSKSKITPRVGEKKRDNGSRRPSPCFYGHEAVIGKGAVVRLVTVKDSLETF